MCADISTADGVSVPVKTYYYPEDDSLVQSRSDLSVLGYVEVVSSSMILSLKLLALNDFSKVFHPCVILSSMIFPLLNTFLKTSTRTPCTTFFVAHPTTFFVPGLLTLHTLLQTCIILV